MSKQPAAGVTDDDDLDGETGGVARTNSGDAKAEEDVAVQVGDYVLGRTLGAGEHRELIMRRTVKSPPGFPSISRCRLVWQGQACYQLQDWRTGEQTTLRPISPMQRISDSSPFPLV